MLHTYYFFQTVDKITFIRLPDLYGQTAIGRLQHILTLSASCNYQ